MRRHPRGSGPVFRELRGLRGLGRARRGSGPVLREVQELPGSAGGARSAPDGRSRPCPVTPPGAAAVGPPGRQGAARRARGPAPPGRAGAAAARGARPFPVCCGEQSLCGAGPGLRDRTVPGTMVGTGTGGLGGIASAVPRPPPRAARADEGRLSRMKADCRGLGAAARRRRGNGCRSAGAAPRAVRAAPARPRHRPRCPRGPRPAGSRRPRLGRGR